VAAKSRQIETEAAPIRYVAELVGADTDASAPSGGWLPLLCYAATRSPSPWRRRLQRGDPLSKATFGPQHLR